MLFLHVMPCGYYDESKSRELSLSSSLTNKLLLERVELLCGSFPLRVSLLRRADVLPPTVKSSDAAAVGIAKLSSGDCARWARFGDAKNKSTSTP
jgi:hypothetical protein